ncbi:hypothetical protein ACB092_01G318500 [Castanea dentata]
MASRRRYCRPLCGEREQISLEPYTEQQKQSPSLHVSPPPSVPFPDSDNQIAETDIDNGFSAKIRLRERYVAEIQGEPRKGIIERERDSVCLNFSQD